MARPSELPVAMVTQKGAQRLRKQNPWCFRSELAVAPDTLERGAVVRVVDGQQNPIGQAFYAQKSQLALRMLSRRLPAEEPIDEAFFRRRLELSLARRAPLAGRDAYRAVHGEADLLPGLFVDKYGKALVQQTLSEGADARKDLFARLLRELTGAEQVVARDDGSGRDFEGLPREARRLSGEGSAKVSFHEGPNLFQVDLLEDFKTGSFLDQVDNHLRAGELGRGEALDTFTYHGGFALALSASCDSVLAVDQDAGAAARTAENAKRNGRANVTAEEGNAFDLLKRFDKEGRKFDTVVLDPPGLAKRREGLATALRAYHELNLRALRILRPEGLLVSCSCSGKLSREGFEEMLLAAAADAKRPVQILERRAAGLDHPALAALPETEYLKAWFVRAL
jgi:23S rRNA (cytosine1962-C5)-methyltransferase